MKNSKIQQNFSDNDKKLRLDKNVKFSSSSPQNMSNKQNKFKLNNVKVI